MSRRRNIPNRLDLKPSASMHVELTDTEGRWLSVCLSPAKMEAPFSRLNFLYCWDYRHAPPYLALEYELLKEK